ncbi:hypothetical protein F3K40_21350 [Streptomyces sp. LBUM 1478]|nr:MULTISPECIES: hypothetical protein [Streptomyces]MBP5861739.1 hypothetical protein [Streptomyces sp. LBUM 1484]MBP5877808.1 hypothetical protein [Streptomyces sp. LBUM 1477]MBP5885642.1 hypothetical protein [Streptomyces sp. LBUM 1487]MBP5891524.1 hypothetical protein [Streptomyces sp. LBUM 1481]MBP5901616.1 hypothetical protein [Streptomyces sp. LBUM 1488]MBP5907773.1 hypothetical protein [Streptomyces sp. LBUM 1478]MBP5921680.1 hypothetical protein [Streptomyces sp. LBUM 1483]MBP592929
MSTAEHRPRPSSSGAGGVSMRDLLAACAAAKVISTPPVAPPVAPPVKGEGRRGVDERRPRAAA